METITKLKSTSQTPTSKMISSGCFPLIIQSTGETPKDSSVKISYTTSQRRIKSIAPFKSKYIRRQGGTTSKRIITAKFNHLPLQILIKKPCCLNQKKPSEAKAEITEVNTTDLAFFNGNPLGRAKLPETKLSCKERIEKPTNVKATRRRVHRRISDKKRLEDIQGKKNPPNQQITPTKNSIRPWSPFT